MIRFEKRGFNFKVLLANYEEEKYRLYVAEEGKTGLKFLGQKKTMEEVQELATEYIENGGF